MPYIRESYQTKRQNTIDAIQYGLLNGQVPLANSPLRVLAEVLASTGNAQDLFFDDISIQFTPLTATASDLDNWCALKSVYRKAATPATGAVVFTGTTGTTIPASTTLVSNDGQTYTTDQASTVGSNVNVTATTAGAAGNQQANTVLTLQAPIAGVDAQIETANGITQGTDLEGDDALKIRMLQAYQSQLTGATKADHIKNTLAVPGVTMAWMPNTPKAGTEVVIWFMLDRTNATMGYPQGTDGTATSETRYENATGDQLTVANALFDDKPYTEIQILCSPIKTPISFEISGLINATATTRAAIRSAIQDVLHAQGDPNGVTITLASIDAAIASAASTTSFTLVSPASDIVTTTGQLPEINGDITFS
ncbi:phage baseplate protein [Acetobacter lambici]|uniref:Baseplate J/gp47 family protein n=1 Tax=Acetobacter lambici TaxID=1332824 RepID=A0ABT1F402_9PROT|nr:baseplate J/gp47 family protein [Acetobacter lambici]MCP1243834.1 baseplate J/gp47 family protein [Acetobacter lambici]MCP1259942.1 baseplate J/gp47 family protein [Acetobacter lambici]NHO58057.1 phage baseplate protein [Acetobacter lambici]